MMNLHEVVCAFGRLELLSIKDTSLMGAIAHAMLHAPSGTTIKANMKGWPIRVIEDIDIGNSHAISLKSKKIDLGPTNYDSLKLAVVRAELIQATTEFQFFFLSSMADVLAHIKPHIADTEGIRQSLAK